MPSVFARTKSRDVFPVVMDFTLLCVKLAIVLEALFIGGGDYRGLSHSLDLWSLNSLGFFANFSL